MNEHKKTENIIHYLEGKWQLSRSIDGSHSAFAKGVAYFKPTIQPNVLHYSEDVEILLNKGTRLKGYQHYIYRCENDVINVYFSDGHRLFHSISNLLEPNHEYTASHYCKLDTYHTSYIFMGNHFEIEHRVKGPKKDYISHSVYTR